MPSMKLGVLTTIREESTMFETAPNEAKSATQTKIEQKLKELADLISEQEYGPGGPPKDLTFREIEQAGFEAAQRTAAQFQATATAQHQRHFEGSQPCPKCDAQCEPNGLLQRKLLTRLGPAVMTEIEFHCNACRRSFFPSA